jgi:hypothetical protein
MANLVILVVVTALTGILVRRRLGAPIRPS